MTEDQKMQRLHAICGIFVDAVKAGGLDGAPGGVMYAAVLDKMSLGQFQQIMAALVTMGKIRKLGDCYHFVANL